jgi:hypothetical protein
VKAPRRDRHTSHVYEVVRNLDTLKETAANAEQIVALADALALWAHTMIRLNPTSAGHIYRALCDAWKHNRNELYGVENMSDPRERRTVAFHGLTLDCYRALMGVPPDGTPKYQPLIDERAALLSLMAEQAQGIIERTDGPQAEAIDPAEPTQPGAVVDLQCWRESRPRPLKRTLFAEQSEAT